MRFIPMKYIPALLALCLSLPLDAQVRTSIRQLSGAQLGELGKKYSRIEEYYENFRQVKEIRYPHQEVEKLADTTVIVTIPRLSSEKYTYNLTAGDTIDLEVHCFRNKNLKKRRKFKMASFIEGESSVRASRVKSDSLVAKNLPIYLTGPHTLEIDNSWKVKNRYCTIELTRRSKVVPEVYLFVPDTTYHEDSTLQELVVDTVLSPLIDTTVSVAAVLDLDHPSTASVSFVTQNLELQANSDTLYSHYIYWIGVGAESIAAYDALAQEIPKGTVPPDLSPPLAAYALDKITQLPDSNIEEVTVNGKSVTKGAIFTGNTKDAFHFINKNTVNRYPIRLVAIAVYKVWNSQYIKGKMMRIGTTKVKAE